MGITANSSETDYGSWLADGTRINNGGALIATRVLPPPVAGVVNYNVPSFTVTETAVQPYQSAKAPLQILYPPQTFYQNGVKVV